MINSSTAVPTVAAHHPIPVPMPQANVKTPVHRMGGCVAALAQALACHPQAALPPQTVLRKAAVPVVQLGSTQICV